MLDTIAHITLGTLGLALLIAFIRLVKGPTLPDRIVAMDLFGVLVVALIVVLAGRSGVRATLDAAIGKVEYPGLDLSRVRWTAAQRALKGPRRARGVQLKIRFCPARLVHQWLARKTPAVACRGRRWSDELD